MLVTTLLLTSAFRPGAISALRPIVDARSSRSASGPAMLENPLARYFGRGKEKQKEKSSSLAKSIDQVLEGAPLPVKIIANVLIKPLAGALETVLAENADDTRDLVDQAVRALRRDPDVASALGVPPDAIDAGSIFSSMGGSSSINGRVSKNLQLQFQLPSGGVAAVRGKGDETGRMKLVDVQVRAGGRVLTVVGVGGAGGDSGRAGGDGGVIDVEATTIDV